MVTALFGLLAHFSPIVLIVFIYKGIARFDDAGVEVRTDGLRLDDLVLIRAGLSAFVALTVFDGLVVMAVILVSKFGAVALPAVVVASIIGICGGGYLQKKLIQHMLTRAEEENSV